MTYGDKIRQEAAQKAAKEATQTRNLEIARTMLQDRAPLDQVSKWTGLNQTVLQQLNARVPL